MARADCVAAAAVATKRKPEAWTCGECHSCGHSRRIVGREAAIDAARRNHRDFTLEGDEAFENQRHAAQRLIGPCGIVTLAEHTLALAVIAHAARLEHTFPAEFGKGCDQIVLAVYAAELRGRDTTGGEEFLFRQPVLRTSSARGGG